jgi:hypothetical protein
VPIPIGERTNVEVNAVVHAVLKDILNILCPVIVIAAFPYIAADIRRWLDDRFSTSWEEDLLAELAARTGASVYGIFCRAGERWNVARDVVEADFSDYLLLTRVPYYVRDFIKMSMPAPA